MTHTEKTGLTILSVVLALLLATLWVRKTFTDTVPDETTSIASQLPQQKEDGAEAAARDTTANAPQDSIAIATSRKTRRTGKGDKTDKTAFRPSPLSNPAPSSRSDEPR